MLHYHAGIGLRGKHIGNGDTATKQIAKGQQVGKMLHTASKIAIIRACLRFIACVYYESCF
jgi:hypothetical protein